jgi:membrane protease subunit (stomatin/prohibitin family)
MVGGVVQGAMGAMASTNLNQSPGQAPAPASQQLCVKCQKPLPPNAKFCLECGEKVVTLKENEITCPACNKTVAKGKFCSECGADLIAKCPGCGAQVPENSKFCLECGKNLKG